MNGVETITDAEIEHLKNLSRLEMTPEETARAKADINAILESFQKLQELDLHAYPEMPRPVPLENIMRDDEARAGFTQSEALGIAVDSENGFFKVPRTVE
jgi:aspartyl-tRNA(Asn)/glutamyl-tRNA(Gln) amidotransferase subunit C